MIDMDPILAFSQRLAEEFHPRQIILFGSYANGTAREDSDVDLLVIAPFQGNAFDRATEMLRRVNAPFPIDLLVRDPADTARRYRQFDPLIRDALDRGKVLYDSCWEGFRERLGGNARRDD
jgi:predicted nucleotidyltransferase